MRTRGSNQYWHQVGSITMPKLCQWFTMSCCRRRGYLSGRSFAATITISSTEQAQLCVTNAKHTININMIIYVHCCENVPEVLLRELPLLEVGQLGHLIAQPVVLTVDPLAVPQSRAGFSAYTPEQWLKKHALVVKLV